jgi:hypothetical protein
LAIATESKILHQKQLEQQLHDSFFQMCKNKIKNLLHETKIPKNLGHSNRKQNIASETASAAASRQLIFQTCKIKIKNLLHETKIPKNLGHSNRKQTITSETASAAASRQLIS